MPYTYIIFYLLKRGMRAVKGRRIKKRIYIFLKGGAKGKCLLGLLPLTPLWPALREDRSEPG
jgi:hypothetical protein